MKKRRQCDENEVGSSVNSPEAEIHWNASEATRLRISASFQDLNKIRRRIKRGNAAKRSRRSRQQQTSDSPKFTHPERKDAFGSLESLFDVRRPLKLQQEVPITYTSSPEYHDLSISESETNVENPEVDFLNVYSGEDSEKEEISRATSERISLIDENIISELEELERDVIEENPEEESNVEEADEEMDEKRESKQDEKEETPEKARSRKTTEHGVPERLKSIKVEPIINHDNNSGKKSVAKPPEYPLPPGIGEGALIEGDGEEHRRDSILSSTPLTDHQVIKEMTEAEERCRMIKKDIEETKKQISEMKHKQNLSEEDTKKLQEKQSSILAKMKEFDEITRRIQRVVGLSDPSSRTFAKMFELLPYPHQRGDGPESVAAKEKKSETGIKGAEIGLDSYEDGHFELPGPEYPEDKLPRAIVCGFTEDKIPKIVIPDSRPRSTRCLRNLTGKLSESLSMQDKLAQENAMLESGRYKLEEALLEKDNTLDSLQRQVCGLQAEMRIVVKENTELNRQLASLNNSQRYNGIPACCCSSITNNNSPRSSNRQQSSYSYASSPRREDESCRCTHCLKDRYELESRQAVNPGNSPRLSGGGSREGFHSSSCPPSERGMCCRGPAGGKLGGTGGRPCPALENQSMSYGMNTKELAQQLESMQSDVRNMQMQLANVHRERQQLEQQKNLLKCTGPCAPCSCCPPGVSQCLLTGQGQQSQQQPSLVPCVSGSSPQTQRADVSFSTSIQAKMGQETQSCSGICVNAPMGASTCPQQQLRDLREQYARLQEDYKNKLCEVSCLRSEVEKMRQETREAKEEREKIESRFSEMEGRVRTMQFDKSRFHGSKEQTVEQEQALLVAKQRYREAQDELEELRGLIQDQATQLEDYRNKYLQAQEQVEEQKRQLSLMEMDNARMNENVNLEIGRVKNQFNEKLAEFAHLPDILMQTHAKLQEVQQMRLIAERNCEDLSRELLSCKDKLNTLTSQLNMMRSDNTSAQDAGSGRLEELDKKNHELRNENERMKASMARYEEQESQLQMRLDEKMHEIVQLTSMLEEVREDSARQVARTKERCETVRKAMQGQIAEMEKQLAQCRATARAAQKDRDEIRQKMQGQINNLVEAFEQAQGRIRSLQGHVNYLKTSYSNIFNAGGGQGEPAIGYMSGDAVGQGYDACDCNY